MATQWLHTTNETTSLTTLTQDNRENTFIIITMKVKIFKKFTRQYNHLWWLPENITVAMVTLCDLLFLLLVDTIVRRDVM